MIGKVYGIAAEQLRRRHFLPKAFLVGIFSGLLGVGFRVGTAKIQAWRLDPETFGHTFAGIATVVAMGVFFGALSVWVILRFCPEAAGGGVTHLQAVMEKDADMRWWRLILVKSASLFSSTATAMGGGPEAPAIHVGGAAGKGVAKILKIKEGTGEHRTLMSAGAAGALSAAFSAPLSGLVFALEELQGNFDSRMLLSALLASVTADIVGRAFVGPDPIFEALRHVGTPDLRAIPYAVILGIFAGLIGVMHNRLIVRVVRFGGGLAMRWRLAIGAAVGVLTGVASLWLPGVSGGGGDLVPYSFAFELTNHPGLLFLGLLFVARFISTICFNTTGAAGGLMIPLLGMGALCGRMLSIVVSQDWHHPEWVPAKGVLLVIGMGAFFSASIRAPLTGLVLIFELTGNYAFMLPTLVACLVAHLMAEEFGDPPMYHALRTDH